MVAELPFWCSRCGSRKVAMSGQSCLVCRSWPRLEQVACGICGQPSAFMYVYGFRCRQHETVRQPLQTIGSDQIVGCLGRMLKPSAI